VTFSDQSIAKATTVVASTTGDASATLTWIGLDDDRVGAWDDTGSNGINDGHFQIDLVVEGPKTITDIRLFSINGEEVPTGQYWDTTPNSWWILATYRDNDRLNPTDLAIDDPLATAGTYTYQIYGESRPGVFTIGQEYAVNISFSDQTVAFAKTIVSTANDAGQGAGTGGQTGGAERPASLTLTWVDLGDDRVGRGSNGTPNGTNDGHFRAVLNEDSAKTVTEITLFSSDMQGNQQRGEFWDTTPNQWWILGVYRDNVRLNPTDAAISDPVAPWTPNVPSAIYDVYGESSPGVFQPGQVYSVTLTFSDRSTRTAWMTIPTGGGTGGDTGGDGTGDTGTGTGTPAGDATLTLAWVGVTGDQVGPGTSAGPNGNDDGQVEAVLAITSPRTVTGITLESRNSPGAHARGVWDTTPGNSWWILGVVSEGIRLNPVDDSISQSVGGVTTYRLFGEPVPGAFEPGIFYTVTIAFSDNTVISETIAHGEGTPGTGVTPPGAGGDPGQPQPGDPAQPQPPTNANSPRLVAGSRTVAPGGTVELPIVLENVAGIGVGSMNFTLSYNSAVVRVDSAVVGDLAADTIFAANTNDPGVIRFGIASNAGTSMTGTGPVAHVTFTAVGSQGQFTLLTLSEVFVNDSGGTQIGILSADGRVTIAQQDPGDFDGDGCVTFRDALAALQMSVGLIPENLNLDRDSDGRITAEDARRLLVEALANVGRCQNG
jgi:hypothetical protein